LKGICAASAFVPHGEKEIRAAAIRVTLFSSSLRSFFHPLPHHFWFKLNIEFSICIINFGGDLFVPL